MFGVSRNGDPTSAFRDLGRQQRARGIALAAILLAVAWASAATGRDLVVSSTADDGKGTLRRALEYALSGDRILFDPAVFSQGTPATIVLATPLPAILQGGITIDGRGAGVIIDGRELTEASGLVLASDRNQVYGLTITNFNPGGGIAVFSHAGWNTIGGGIDGTGSRAGENILGGNEVGIGVEYEAHDNVISGNLIGVRSDGVTPWGNSHSGVGIFDTAGSGNVVGPGNVIAYSRRGAVIGSGRVGNTVTENQIFGNDMGDIFYSDPSSPYAAPPSIDSVDPLSQTVIGTACPGCLVELFVADAGAPNDGAYLGHALADPEGRFSTILADLSGWTSIAATATTEDGSTSMFSGAFGVCMGGEIVVTSAADDGPGSLRWALLDAQPGQRIAFDPSAFPPAAPATILILSPLPALSQGGVIVDARGAGVILDGSMLPDDEAGGLTVASDNNHIYGLTITGFRPGSGIVIDTQARGNVIGESSEADEGLSGANVFGDNDFGVLLRDGATANVVAGNYIGVHADGITAWANDVGVGLAAGAVANTIGPANVIAHNRVGVRTMTGCGGNPVTANRMFRNMEGEIAWDDPTSPSSVPPVITRIDPFSHTVSGTASPGSRVEFFFSVAGARDSDDGVIDEGAWAFQSSVEGTEAEGAFTGSAVADFGGDFTAVLDNLPSWTCIAATATTPRGSTSRYADAVCECLASADSLAPSAPETTPPGVGSHPIRVVTYNVCLSAIEWFGLTECQDTPGTDYAGCVSALVERFAAGGGFAGGTLGRLAWLVDIIRMLNPDILAIQEANLWTNTDGFIAREVARATGLNYCFLDGNENVILTKFDVRSVGDPELNTPALWAELVTPSGLVLHVVSAHLLTPAVLTGGIKGFGAPLMAGRGSAEIARRETQVLVAAMTPYQTEATIFVGDMNARADAPQMSPFWDDGWELVGIEDADMILTSPGFPLMQTSNNISRSVLCPHSHAFGGRLSDYSDTVSDHYPVVVDLWLRP